MPAIVKVKRIQAGYYGLTLANGRSCEIANMHYGPTGLGATWEVRSDNPFRVLHIAWTFRDAKAWIESDPNALTNERLA